jgi:hypothetical protein
VTTRLWPTLRDDALEFLLLRRAEAQRRTIPAPQLELAVELARAAGRRIAAVPGFMDKDGAVVSSSLLCDAAGLLLRAKMATESAPIGDLDVARELRHVCKDAPDAPADWECAALLLAKQGPLAIDQTPIEELRNEGAALKETVRWLRSRTDLRTPESVQWERRGRIAALAVVAVWIVMRLVGHALALPNVALGKPVTASSVGYLSPAPSVLVDGHWPTEPPLISPPSDVFQTNGGFPGLPAFPASSNGATVGPSVTIDLERGYYIREIRLYNRVDKGFDDGLPYEVDVSTDDIFFNKLGERAKHFGSTFFDPPWTIDGKGVYARFVRVRCARYLALSEVEVYGK